jgi:hypothetical protein
MLSSKPCTTTCVIDGAPVTLTYYPDTCDLRISDAGGVCIQKTRWLAPWTALLAALRDFAQLPEASASDASVLVTTLFGIANTNYAAAHLAIEATRVTAANAA